MPFASPVNGFQPAFRLVLSRPTPSPLNLLDSSLQDYELDYHHDQKLDELNLHLEIPIDLRRRPIYSVRLILFFRYRLSQQIDLRMESLVDVHHHGGRLAGQRLRLEGDIELVQRRP